jgi:hypothetical protein
LLLGISWPAGRDSIIKASDLATRQPEVLAA